MDPAFDPSTFPKNKTRLLEHRVSRQFFSAVLAQAKGRKLLSEEHFTVDGTFTDPEAQLAHKGPGKEAKLCFVGHVLMQNRHGLVVDVMLTQATGTAKREAALEMLERLPGMHRATVGGDKNYDTADFVVEC
jgi:hypothetical protein